MSEIKRSMIDYSIISEQSWPVIATSHSFGLVKREKKKDINNETCINNCNGEALSGKTNYKSDRFAIPLMAGKSQF